MCSKITLTALAILAFMAGHDRVQAQDFIFDVPVDVRSLPALISQITVSCYVHNLDSRGSFGTPATQLASGATVQALDRGTFTGRVRVPVTMPPGRAPRDAQAWICSLSLLDDAGRSHNPLLVSDPGNPLFVPALRRQPDAVIVNIVTGRF